MEFLGDHELIHLQAGRAEVVMRAEPDLGVVRGEPLHLAFDPARALLFGADGARLPLALREALHV